MESLHARLSSNTGVVVMLSGVALQDIRLVSLARLFAIGYTRSSNSRILERPCLKERGKTLRRPKGTGTDVDELH
jgi:hypothetical protein